MKQNLLELCNHPSCKIFTQSLTYNHVGETIPPTDYYVCQCGTFVPVNSLSIMTEKEIIAKAKANNIKLLFRDTLDARPAPYHTVVVLPSSTFDQINNAIDKIINSDAFKLQKEYENQAQLQACASELGIPLTDEQ